MLDEASEVDRAQQASAIGRQRLLAAGVGGGDRLAIVEVVAPIDAVDEDHAGLGIGIGRAHDLVPQLARRQHLPHRTLERELPRCVFLDRLHQGVGDQNREVEHAQPAGLLLRLDKGLDIGMVAPQRGHHCTAPIAGAHDRPAHRVPDIHKAQRPGCIGTNALDRRTVRPEGREVIADPSALLHRQRCFAQMGKDPAHIVRDRPHHKAVEQRHPRPAAACACDDAPRREEFEIAHRRIKFRGPQRGVALGRGERRRYPPPGVFDRLVDHLA